MPSANAMFSFQPIRTMPYQPCFWISLKICIIIFSCPVQLNRWPCHWLDRVPIWLWTKSDGRTKGLKKAFFHFGGHFLGQKWLKDKKIWHFGISRAGQLFFLQEVAHINASYNDLKYPSILEQTSRHTQHCHWNLKKQLSNLTHHIHWIKSPERCTRYNNIFYFVIQKNLDCHQSILSYILS